MGKSNELSLDFINISLNFDYGSLGLPLPVGLPEFSSFGGAVIFTVRTVTVRFGRPATVRRFSRFS